RRARVRDADRLVTRVARARARIATRDVGRGIGRRVLMIAAPDQENHPHSPHPATIAHASGRIAVRLWRPASTQLTRLLAGYRIVRSAAWVSGDSKNVWNAVAPAAFAKQVALGLTTIDTRIRWSSGSASTSGSSASGFVPSSLRNGVSPHRV